MQRLDAAVNRGELRWCINNRGVRWGKVLVDEAVQAPLTPADLRDLRLSRGDVLMCEGGDIGRAAVWAGGLPEACFLNTLHRLRPKNGYDPRLLVAMFELWSATGGHDAVVGKATLADLTKENLVRVALPAPDQSEQIRIADVLQDADDLTSSLERLIAKKRAVKRGMMQALLSRTVRLPSFSSSWIEARFADLAGPVKQRVDPATVAPSTPIVELEDVEPRTGRLLARRTVHGAVSQKTAFVPGDVLFSKLRSYLRKFWLAETSGVCSTEFWVLRATAGNSGRFLRYVVQSDAFVVAASGGYGTHMPRADWGVVGKLYLALPPLDEQEAIAQVLQGVDREIAALVSRHSKARDIRTGMSQQLLAGRVRLPVVEHSL